MTEDQRTDEFRSASARVGEGPTTEDANTIDLANRLKAVVTELETGVPIEPGDRLSPSEKLRALADLIDRRAATAHHRPGPR